MCRRLYFEFCILQICAFAMSHSCGQNGVEPSESKQSNGVNGKDDSETPSDLEVSDSVVQFVFHFLNEKYFGNQTSNLQELKDFQDECDKVIETDLRAVKKYFEAAVAEYKALSQELICTEKVVMEGEESWLSVDYDKEISMENISNLMKRAVECQYNAFTEENSNDAISNVCSKMMSCEYIVRRLYNPGGSLCWNYPKVVFIPTAVRTLSPNNSNEGEYDASTAMENFMENFQDFLHIAEKAAVARCRKRFPVPVILYKGKFICRSGTLAVRKGAAYEAIMTAHEPGSISTSALQSVVKTLAGATHYVSNLFAATNIIYKGVDDLKDADVNILKTLGIRYICDLMVEKRKIHTGMNVGSSEKINMAKYGNFRCVQIPYPGCEFFTKYSAIRKSEDYLEQQRKLIFDWETPEVDSELAAPESEDFPLQEINWEEYKTWDLTTLTKNYMRLLLHYVDEGEGGILVHCISGWDRTPLFISLLRISLWADGLIHKELDVKHMAYFTIAYDWYLFGHHLPNRLAKREEIMHFCFKFLPEIAMEEYSLLKKSDEATEDFLKKREERVTALSDLLLKVYEDNVTFREPEIILTDESERTQESTL